jgi:hypothetical protein
MIGGDDHEPARRSEPGPAPAPGGGRRYGVRVARPYLTDGATLLVAHVGPPAFKSEDGRDVS